MHFLITAGPTREHLDDVRFLSNGSSGKMGFACARAAKAAGHRVTLVTGPVALADPPGVRTIRVTSAGEMRRAVKGAYGKADGVIMTAAVADYTPATRHRGKLKKGAASMNVRFVRTPDILRELGARKGKRVLVGFALEVDDAVNRALLKYKKKNMDLVVLDSPRAMEADRMDAIVYREGEPIKRFRAATKRAVAGWLVRAAARLAAPAS